MFECIPRYQDGGPSPFESRPFPSRLATKWSKVPVLAAPPPQPLPTDTRLPMTFRPVLPRYGILRWGSRSLQGEQLPGASSFGKALRFLIGDWGSKCDHECARVAEACSTEALKMPNPAPKANAVCERFLESVRRECPDHLPVVEDRQLHRVIKEYG